MDTQQVICINSDGYQASLVVQKTYRTIPDEAAAQHGLIRVIDETESDGTTGIIAARQCRRSDSGLVGSP